MDGKELGQFVRLRQMEFDEQNLNDLVLSLPRLIDHFAYFTANTSKINNLRFSKRLYFIVKRITNNL